MAISAAAKQQSPADRAWFVVGRWEEFEGEGRANLLRLIAIAAFYAVELINYYGLNLGFVEFPSVVDRSFHLAVTLLAVAWTALAMCVLVCRRNGLFPYWLKYISTGCDLLLLTCVLTLGDGPRSPLLVGYFLIIALAAMRFSMSLIWFVTLGAAVGYLFLLGFSHWGEIPGWERTDTTVPRYHQIIYVLGLGLTGIVLGQVVRRARRAAIHFARRMDTARGGPPK